MNRFITILIVGLCLVLLGSFFLLYIIFSTKNNTSNSPHLLNNLRINLSEELFAHPHNNCNIKYYTNSQGLLIDAAIICEVTRNWSACPYFHFEDAVDNPCPSDWIFVNLDCTHFDLLLSRSSSPRNILCKTMLTYRILQKYFDIDKLHYTGFTSIDRYDKNVSKKYDKFLHIAGKSPAKGTDTLLKSWLKHPEWPELIIICRDNIIENVVSKNNITILRGFISENKLQLLANQCGIHICISQYEGFGHNINEARSVGAVVLYTDAPGMNEQFIPYKTGIPVEYTTMGVVNKICPKYMVNNETFANAMNYVLSLNPDQLKIVGANARKQFLLDDEKFKQTFTKIVLGAVVIPKKIHTMWISSENLYEDVNIPEKYIKYQNSIHKCNPDFKYYHWSGKSILNAIQTHFPQYVDFYRKLTPTICKCDFARMIIICIYGGIYIDLDFMCVKNLTPLTKSPNIFVMEPPEHIGLYKGLLCNGFFGACQKDPFIIGWVNAMLKNRSPDVVKKTGPAGMYDYYTQTNNNVFIGDTCKVLSIIHAKKTIYICKGFYNTYLTTKWSDGSEWAGKFPEQEKKFKTVINPIDNKSELLWEESNFTKKNQPDIYYDIDEKKSIFNLSLKNKPSYGVIDVGAHIGDLAVPLAQALANANRSDIIVYAIDPSQKKCDFIEKMKGINGINNLQVINTGLSDQTATFGHSTTDVHNTGAQKWEKNLICNDAGSEHSKFVPLDSLMNVIGPVGLYHIDVEGHELSVLKGSRNFIQKYKPIVLLEVWISDNAKCKKMNDCPAIFQELNMYTLASLLPNGDMIWLPK